jgi:hypothetical protein
MAGFMDKLNSLLPKKNAESTPLAGVTPVNVPNQKSGFAGVSSLEDFKALLQNKFGNQHPNGREINLVPDVKEEMIKALKLRNLTFFLCIVVASASVIITLIFASIAGGQQAVVDGKKNTLANLSAKISSYSDLNDFLTIKGQLENVDSISSNKKLLSRTFNIISTLLPTGADWIKISELSINLSNNEPVISFDAQANAGNPPYIDYNVLDSFKKTMQYMRYDYGDYVDKNGTVIPAYCIIETSTDGATLSDPERGYYAYWLIKGKGCNPSYEPELDEEGNEKYDEIEALKGYTIDDYNGNQVVKIWRTPQYNDWYKKEEKENQPYMSLDGVISGVAHFESACTTYSGTKDEVTGEINWTSSNETCLLVPDGIDGINISDSSNGRGAEDELVLRFSASITLNPEVYSFNNHHVLARGPSGRYNVTDSYVQIQNMFSERAADCDPNDTACNNNGNKGGE